MLLLFAQPLAGQILSVIRKKRLWPDGGGQIEITEQAIVYRAEKESESRTWNYPDIQFFDRLSSREFTILTYEDQRRKLGRDRRFHFTITEGELTDELLETLQQWLRKPVTNRVVGEVSGVEYELPVKHLHSLGGCEGRLIFTTEAVYYATENTEDSREWRLAQEIESVWSSDPYRLELHVYENNRREFSRTRVFRFALKEPLDGAYYRKLKLRLYSLESAHLPM